MLEQVARKAAIYAEPNKKAALNTAQEVAKAFLSWPEHKAVAMNADYTKTGAAWARVDNQIYWVQLFG